MYCSCSSPHICFWIYLVLLVSLLLVGPCFDACENTVAVVALGCMYTAFPTFSLMRVVLKILTARTVDFRIKTLSFSLPVSFFS
jgi:hypothetical protein